MPRRGGQLVKGSSTIKGLRLEPDIYEAVAHRAQEMAAEHGIEVNMAAAARDLIRRGLGVSQHHSCDREAYKRALAEARVRVHKAFSEVVE